MLFYPNSGSRLGLREPSLSEASQLAVRDAGKSFLDMLLYIVLLKKDERNEQKKLQWKEGIVCDNVCRQSVLDIVFN